MKKTMLAAAVFTLSLAGAAHAENIGVSMALFDDNFLTVLRTGMQNYAKTLDGVNLQVEDAQNDVGRQLNQIQNFVASGVSAIIVNPVDTDATTAMSKLAEDAKIPLVYVNRQPVNLDKLPKNQAFVASNEVDSGTLETKEVCRLLKAAGKTSANILVMMGELSNQAGRQRTKDIHDVIATPECSFMKIVEEQTGNWKRTEGQDLMTNWISASVKFDAVISNNDEMALGAIQALKAAKVSHEGRGRRRHRRDAGRARRDAGGRSRRDGVPGCGRPGQRRGRGGGQSCARQAAGAEDLGAVPARHAGQHGEIHEEELSRLKG